MDPFFSELGRAVLNRWQAANFSLEQFPAIATDALTECAPATSVDVSALIRDFLLNDEQPLQTASPFGEPELIVFDHPRFYIQILFWFEGTTEIHQHTFSGAFHVLAGSSLHSHFSFEDVQPVTANFRLGNLRVKDTRLLETGSTVPIVSGPSCIHSLFHLDSPSLTVVVRTHNDPGTRPQFTYLPPHIAIDPYHDDTLTARRRQLLDVLERLEDPSYPDLVFQMLDDLDLERAFFVLQSTMRTMRDLGRWEEAWEIFSRKHGDAADLIAVTLDEIIWRDGPLVLRGTVTDPEHRFFLSLLLNVPNSGDLLSIVGQRFDGPPIDTVVRWAEELMEATGVGAWILDAEFPSEVDVPAGKQGETLLGTLRHFLSSGSDEPLEISGCIVSPKDLARIRESFVRSSLRALVS